MRAEDRFGWLDDEAAEDLLRGPAADGSSSCPAPHAEELASALDGLVESHQPAECAKELPGEAEALAAFRTARSRRCRGGAPGARSRRGRYMTRLSGTPLHVGLAMTLAGFALGGVAVAASNGVLPAPFGDDGGQGPGASGGRPPAVEPLESGDGERGADNGTGGGSDDPTRRLPGGGSPSESGQGGGGSDRDYRDIAGVHRGNSGDLESDSPSTDRPSTWPHEPRPDRDEESPNPGSWPPKPPSTQPDGPDHTVVVALCRAYEGDQIEQRNRLQLERVAGGPEQVERYCEEYGDVGGGGGGTEGGDGDSGGVGIPEQPEPEEPEEPDGSDGGADGGGSGGAGGAGGGDGDGSGGGGAAGGAGGDDDEVSGGSDSSGGTEGADGEDGGGE